MPVHAFIYHDVCTISYMHVCACCVYVQAYMHQSTHMRMACMNILDVSSMVLGIMVYRCTAETLQMRSTDPYTHGTQRVYSSTGLQSRLYPCNTPYCTLIPTRKHKYMAENLSTPTNPSIHSSPLVCASAPVAEQSTVIQVSYFCLTTNIVWASSIANCTGSTPPVHQI